MVGGDTPAHVPNLAASGYESHDVLDARAQAVAAAATLEEPVELGRAPARGWRRAVAVALGVLAAASLLVAYFPALEWMVGRWSDAHGYYGHGPLVPLVSLYLAWRARRQLVPAPDRAGLALGTTILLAASVLQVGAAALRVHFVSGASLLLVLAGVALVLGGLRFARALAFPIGFLAFAVPLPMLAVAQLSLELKLLAAKAAIVGLNLVGITALRDGSVVHLSAGDVTVEDVCSGMRSLIALLAMGVLVTGLETRLRPWRRALLVVLTVPIAIAANAVRVAFLCGAVHVAGPGILDTFVHEGSGLLLFAVAMGLLLSARAALASGDEPVVTFPREAARLHLPSLVVVAAALVPGAVATRVLDRAAHSSAPPVATGLPLELPGWRGTELPIEPYVREVLETNDLISRRYARDGRDAVFLYVAASRGDSKVAHPPEVCLSGNGFTLEERGEIELARDVRGKAIMLSRGADRQVIVYFYAAGEALGPDYMALQLRAGLERFRSPDVPSALVRMSTRLGAGTTPEVALETIRGFSEALVPALRKRLSASPEEVP